MIFIQFLIDTPVVAFMALLVLLITVVPVVSSFLSRKMTGQADEAGAPVNESPRERLAEAETGTRPAMPVKEPPSTRFLGTQMDIAILIFGFLLLLALIGWLHKTFFK